MYKAVNIKIKLEDHDWLKQQRALDSKFKQQDFIVNAVEQAIKKAKKVTK